MESYTDLHIQTYRGREKDSIIRLLWIDKKVSFDVLF
jgi:hypothetical protein